MHRYQLVITVTSLTLAGCIHRFETSSPVTSAPHFEPRPSPGFVIPQAWTEEQSSTETMFEDIEEMMLELDEELEQLDAPKEF